jgi:hypothetical protein
MKMLQVRLPENIHRRAKQLSKEANVSLNQFILTSVSNEIVREETADFFRDAAANFDARAFADALAAIPDADPVAGDEL